MAALVSAVDDIHAHNPIGDDAWRILASHYSPKQLIDLVMTVGEFALVATILSPFQIKKEDIPGLETLESFR